MGVISKEFLDLKNEYLNKSESDNFESDDFSVLRLLNLSKKINICQLSDKQMIKLGDELLDDAINKVVNMNRDVD